MFLGHNTHAILSIGNNIISPNIDKNELETKTKKKSLIPILVLYLITNAYPQKEKQKDKIVAPIMTFLKEEFLKNCLYKKIPINTPIVEKKEIFPNVVAENFSSLVKK